jgi:large subunit ribosomal protein L32e
MAKKFVRRDAHKKKRISNTWRKPKGLQNKMRLQTRGHSKNVKPGYIKQPKGQKIIDIYNKEQLKGLDPKLHSVVIAKVSKRKKLEIIEEAEKLKLTIVNLNLKLYKEKAEEFLKARKEAAKKKQERDAKKKVAEKKTEEKEEEKKEEKKEELSDEEKKKKEKAEKDKILTTKGV